MWSKSTHKSIKKSIKLSGISGILNEAVSKCQIISSLEELMFCCMSKLRIHYQKNYELQLGEALKAYKKEKKLLELAE